MQDQQLNPANAADEYEDFLLITPEMLKHLEGVVTRSIDVLAKYPVRLAVVAE